MSARAVHASGGFKFFVDKGLCAETDAIDSRGDPLRRLSRFDGFGVGFERDFFKFAGKDFANGASSKSAKKSRLQKTGRAATDVNGVDYSVVR